ncbi:LacI family DNA-binding transcriptional regulator [Paenibacillus piri]|uniref:LacI family transcriptional regulator n=1 Tax=Paenibacillus piri TaxID=2547395 RepID=A0A4R5KR69_9BACL|nr:LacI family DNA-binding transcriptional regulator [Paenibacillus piri]TDF97498.1 LacI family transcriptional regulator [Paenibacillus piri]
MPIKKSVTLQSLADELGVTIQTVSKALRGHPGMSEETRRLIWQTANERGYRTKEQLRQLEQDRIPPYPVFQRRFVLVQTEQSLGFHRLLMQGLQERFAEFGHRIMPVLLPPSLQPSGFAAWVEAQSILYADGIFIAPRVTPDWFEERLLQLDAPRILLNFPPPEAKVDSVVWDVYEAMYVCVRTLHRKGHRNIMYVGDIRSQRGFILRWQAFTEAMREIGEEVRMELHAVGERQSDEPWLAAVEQKFRQLQPTAVICGIDEDVAPVYYRLQSIAAIPRQCSFVAFLNEPSPMLPLMDRPSLLIREAGYRAADRMLWRIANPQQPYEHIRLRAGFQPGNTVNGPQLR